MNETKSPSVYFESDPRAEIARPHILVLTNMFPNPGQPFLGVFVSPNPPKEGVGLAS